MIDFYELLGVSSSASPEEIRKAYRAMAKKYHPDINNCEDANKIIRSLNEAKEILLDVEKRREYDSSLNAIKYSKQFSKTEEDTYKTRKEEHKEAYSQVYVTKWEYYINYINTGLDKFYLKIFKSLLALVNSIFFNTLRCFVYVLLYVFFLLEKFIDFFAGILIVISILYLFNLGNIKYLSFINNNVLGFCLFFFLGLLVIFTKIFIVKGSVNLVVFFENLEDKLFVKIITF